jgi:hypothetical protein
MGRDCSVKERILMRLGSRSPSYWVVISQNYRCYEMERYMHTGIFSYIINNKYIPVRRLKVENKSLVKVVERKPGFSPIRGNSLQTPFPLLAYSQNVLLFYLYVFSH